MLLTAIAAFLMDDPFSNPCQDDRGRDRCSAEMQAATLEVFSAQPLSTYNEQRTAVRRVFYVNGYGSDIMALEFFRPEGARPFVKVSAPTTSDGKQTSIEAPISDEDWAKLVSQSERLEWLITKPPASANPAKADGQDDIVLCLHSWVYWAEATGDGERRSTVNDACQ
ncbi:MAG: hypothetical protein HKO13_03190 [Sphingomonas sp.]|nr:hypothetical protein [Sphingomonas sp.]